MGFTPNPSLSARNKEQRELFLILFYRDTGNSFTSIQVKQNKDNRRRWLLISCQGTPNWDGRAKRSQFRPQSRQKTKQGKRESVLVSCQGTPNLGWASKAKPIPPLRQTLSVDCKTHNKSSFPLLHFTFHLKQRWASKAKPIPTYISFSSRYKSTYSTSKNVITKH